MYAEQNKADLKVMLLRLGIIRLDMAWKGFDARHHRVPALVYWSGAPAHYRCGRRSSVLCVVTMEWHYQERLVLFIVVVNCGGMDGVLSPPHLAGDVEQAGLNPPVLPTKSSVKVYSAAGLQWPCIQRSQ